jgi:hypothetical protein
MLDKLKEAALARGMKLMGNPRVMKLLSDPRVGQAMMRMFQLRGEIDTALDRHLKSVARRFRLATRDDVKAIQESLRALEENLQAMQSRVDGEDRQGD